jgi:uncharacterized membrane protein YbhN (UPF0104 family)
METPADTVGGARSPRSRGGGGPVRGVASLASRRIPRLALRAAGCAGALAAALAGALTVDWGSFAGALSGTRLSLLLLAGALHAASIQLGAVGWWAGLRAARMPLRLADVTRAHWIGEAGCALLPARLGEVARVVVLRPLLAHEDAPGGRLAGSLLAQRLLAAVATATWIAAVTAAVGLPGFAALRPAAAALLLAAVPLTLAVRRVGRGRGGWERATRGRLTGALARGAGVLRDPAARRQGFLVQMAVILCDLAGVAACLAAFHLPVRAVLVVFTLRCLAGFVPVTPAGVGVAQAAIVVPLGVSYGVAAAPALAFALGLQATALGVALAGALVAAVQRRRAGEPAAGLAAESRAPAPVPAAIA